MNEQLLQKKLAGGELSDAEILAAAASERRAEIEAEAAKVTNLRSLAAEREKRFEQRIAALLSSDAEAEAATREYENVCREFDDFCLSTGKRLLAAKARIVSAQQKFGSVIKAEIPRVDRIKNNYEPEVEADLKQFLEMAKQRGARLESVCSELWQPHLLYQPAFCRANAYESPATVFGALVFRVELMVAAAEREGKL